MAPSSSKPRMLGADKHPRSLAAFTWDLLGPTLVIGQPACPIYPEFFYEVGVNSQTDAEIQHIIWNKKPPAGSTAIERVCVDNEGDFAVGKTPHYSDLRGRICIMSFCSFGIYELQVTVIWQDTTNNGRHCETKSIRIESRQAP
jgi:hypothetical protein